VDSLVADFKGRRHRISLTALIDVVFILLLFFMLTSSFSQWRAVSFQWPVAVAQQQEVKPQFVRMHSDGGIEMVDGALVLTHYSELSSVHGPSFAADRPVILLPMNATPLQDVVAALELLRSVSGLSVSYGGAIAAGSAE
jgi:biopolymer transport protein ExbD